MPTRCETPSKVVDDAVAEKALYATAHRIRFRQITTPEMLQLSESPGDALSWKVGPSGPVRPDGYRLPADVWCAVGLYGDSDSAKTALQLRERFMPFLRDAVESWHAVLMPFAHKGECNHLDQANRIPVACAW